MCMFVHDDIKQNLYALREKLLFHSGFMKLVVEFCFKKMVNST